MSRVIPTPSLKSIPPSVVPVSWNHTPTQLSGPWKEISLIPLFFSHPSFKPSRCVQNSVLSQSSEHNGPNPRSTSCLGGGSSSLLLLPSRSCRLFCTSAYALCQSDPFLSARHLPVPFPLTWNKTQSPCRGHKVLDDLSHWRSLLPITLKSLLFLQYVPAMLAGRNALPSCSLTAYSFIFLIHFSTEKLFQRGLSDFLSDSALSYFFLYSTFPCLILYIYVLANAFICLPSSKCILFPVNA